MAAASSKQGDPSLLEFFRVSLGLNSKDTAHQTPLPLQVIGAGLPRTGTASFVVALSKLGLRSYHMKDGAIETPGHLDLWYSLYHPEDKNLGNAGAVSLDDILDDMALQGFTATSDGPSCFWYKQQMKRYSDAKVVLTVRGDGSGEVWERSFSANIIDVLVSMQDIPYRWFSMFQKIDGMARTMLDPLGVDVDPGTKFPSKDQLPGAYKRWVEEVKATVPQ